MATETTNYGLKKPDASDFYNVDDFNGNFDKIDEALKNLEGNVEDFNGNFDKIDAALKDLEGADEDWKDAAVSEAVKQMDSSGNAATATKLKTARTIGGISFDGSKDIYHYGTCYTSATLKSKTSSITGLVLSTGAKVAIRFVNGISVDDATLNVTGTGAKQIKYKGKNLKTGAIQKNTLVELIYDGSSWLIIGELSCAGAAQDFFGSHNLNDCTTPGRYICHVAPNETWENAPSGWHTCWLDVNENQGVITQVLTEYDGRNIYIRGYYNTWSAWKKISGTSI